jgi:hypothetical protein
MGVNRCTAGAVSMGKIEMGVRRASEEAEVKRIQLGGMGKIVLEFVRQRRRRGSRFLSSLAHD